MAPEKGGAKDAEIFWRTSIESAVLNDKNFSMRVVMIDPAGSDQDRIYLTKFENFATEEKRFVTKFITRTETIFMVNQLGETAKVINEDYRVFQKAQNFLREKQDIPPEYMALIIKRLIMNMKDEYHFIQRQKLRVTEGLQKESKTMLIKEEVRGTVSSADPPSPPKPPISEPKKGKGKKGAVESPQVIEDEGKKYNTQLRLRGEEWRDKIYVEDFPVDGPDLYIAITNFQDPDLPTALVKIGVAVTAIVEVRVDPTGRKIPSSLYRPTKRGSSQTEFLMEKSLQFWADLQHLRLTSVDLKGTAFIVFTPPYWNSDDLSGEAEKINDELCFLLYDVQDLSRQHAHYLDNVEILHIPKNEEDVRLNRLYHRLIDDLPLESVTIYSVLDSLLQTVANRDILTQEISRSSIPTTTATPQWPTSVRNDHCKRAEGFANDVFRALCQGDETRKSYRITDGEEIENLKDPFVLNYGDIAKYNTFHLGNINLDNIVYSSLEMMPLHRLWLNIMPPTESLEAKINFHVNTLLACFERGDVETAELERLLHILTCRKLYNNRSSLHKRFGKLTTLKDFQNTYLKRSLLAQPITKCPSLVPSGTTSSIPSVSKMGLEQETMSSYDDEQSERRVRMVFECPDISELVSAAEIANGAPIGHIIDDFDYYEDFSSVAAFQILHDAYNKFNCLDYKYCEVTDCIVMMFFNSHDKDGLAREEWRCHIPTLVCLQDFFDYVLEENYDWIQNEEEIYYRWLALVACNSVHKDIFDPDGKTSCIENQMVAMDMLMEGSLKYQEIAKIELSSSSSGMFPPSYTTTSKKTTVSGASNDGAARSKVKAKATETTKRSEHTTRIKPFIGYDLGDRRVEAFGKDTTFFSKDGTKVTSMYYLIIPQNFEWIILNIIPGNGNNQFWVHKIVGEAITPEQMEISESFRINSKDQVMINIKKVSDQVPIVSLTPSAHDVECKRLSSTHSTDVTVLDPVNMKTEFYHSLYVTWPNGLVIESVHEENSRNISHIKQAYITNAAPQLNEDARCITLQGEVIIFKSSGEIEVLRPDASFINITKYGKRAILPDIILDDQSSGKAAKEARKGGKEKGKNAKSTSKQSKNVNMEEEKVEPPPVYELFIEQYDITQVSGIVEKFFNKEFKYKERLLIQTATDYCLGEVFSRRMDGTNMLLNKDGVHTVTFMNGTRIITQFVIEDEEVYPEWTDYELAYFEMLGSDTVEGEEEEPATPTKHARLSIPQSYTGSKTTSGKGDGEEEEESEGTSKPRTDGYISVQVVFTVEHPNFATVTMDVAKRKVTVTSPNGSSVTVDYENHYDIILDPVTTATFDGRDLNINYEACLECHSSTICNVRLMKEPERQNYSRSMHDLHMSMHAACAPHAEPWVKMKDSFCNKFVVNDEGEMSLVDDLCSQDVLHAEETAESADKRQAAADTKSEGSLTSHGMCHEMYMAKKTKYFVMKRDLTCSELVHRSLVQQYQNACRWQPWCSIESYDSFGDHRRLLSILSPVHLNESEKWLMESKLAGKPKHLTYQHLRSDPGKGFYHWMRPYERFEPQPMKPANVLPARLPRAFILRTLEQQWTAEKRNELKGAKELLSAILKYRQIMDSDSESALDTPVIDHRTDAQKRAYSDVQALGRRIYEDLKKRLRDDAMTRVKADITTKPEPIEEEYMLEEEEAEEDRAEEERVRHFQELDAVMPMSENRLYYWRRRAEELKEEEFYKYLLRDGTVPPYFRNPLGGALWLELDQQAGDALTRADRRQMKCVCAEEQTDSVDPDAFHLV